MFEKERKRSTTFSNQVFTNLSLSTTFYNFFFNNSLQLLSNSSLQFFFKNLLYIFGKTALFNNVFAALCTTFLHLSTQYIYISLHNGFITPTQCFRNSLHCFYLTSHNVFTTLYTMFSPLFTHSTTAHSTTATTVLSLSSLWRLHVLTLAVGLCGWSRQPQWLRNRRGPGRFSNTWHGTWMLSSQLRWRLGWLRFSHRSRGIRGRCAGHITGGTAGWRARSGVKDVGLLSLRCAERGGGSSWISSWWIPACNGGLMVNGFAFAVMNAFCTEDRYSSTGSRPAPWGSLKEVSLDPGRDSQQRAFRRCEEFDAYASLGIFQGDFLEPSMMHSFHCVSSRAEGGGDAGSLTPRYLATRK